MEQAQIFLKETSSCGLLILVNEKYVKIKKKKTKNVDALSTQFNI